MNKATTLKKIQQIEFHARECLQIAAELRKDLGLDEETKISKYMQKKMEAQARAKKMIQDYFRKSQERQAKKELMKQNQS